MSSTNIYLCNKYDWAPIPSTKLELIAITLLGGD